MGSLVFPICAVLVAIAKLSPVQTQGVVLTRMKACDVMGFACGKQLVPFVRTIWTPIADLCTDAGKARAGFGIFLCTKGAIVPNLGLI